VRTVSCCQTVAFSLPKHEAEAITGTWAWGNKFLWGYDPDMDPELQDIFDYAIAQGVNLFDTADSYGTGALNGRSEELLGKFMRENQKIQDGAPVHIATKLAGYPWRVTPMNMTAACRYAGMLSFVMRLLD
jgi:pyridoxine 4-dehydrogenase